MLNKPSPARSLPEVSVRHGSVGGGDSMWRREFMVLVGSAIIGWPRSAWARASQPVIGVVGSASSGGPVPGSEAAFVQGLKDAGFIDGQNVSIEWRWAEGRYGRLPSLIAELVHRPVAALVAFDAPTAAAAKAATETIPIVFTTGTDPVKTGLVESLSRPGGNVTGVTILITVLGPKRLELLHELVPSATRIALLVNPDNPNAEAYTPEIETAAETLGLRMEVLRATTEGDLETAFAEMQRRRVEALVLMPDPFLIAKRERLVALAARNAIPAIYPVREFMESGGLMTYGTRVGPLFQRAGRFTAKILRGAKPADLPVDQIMEFELVINLKAARALGLTVTPALLARADEVIE